MNTDAERLFFEGNAHLAARDHVRAEACFRDAVSLAPLLAEAHANLGWVMAETGDLEEAESLYRRALALSANDNHIRLNYGAFLARMKKFEAAQRVYLGAVDVDPQSAPVWSNLGALYAQVERYDEAEACCRRSIAIDPMYPKAHINLAYICLRDGRLEEGFAHYEWRTWQAALWSRLACPRWAGESLVGRSILIGHEAGYGDAIQFGRYASVLKTRGARRVTLLCPAPLEELFASLEDVDDVLPMDAALPPAGWDCWTSLMSLPHHVGTRLDSIPASVPYVSASAPDVARWKARLPIGKPLVGLAWRGNPRFENDADRSISSITTLQPLLDVAGVTFVSLQKHADVDADDAELAACGVFDAGRAIESFADTAAIVANLDLVISVDTAAAHLAGAMGKACWVMLPRHMTDWRWLADRADTPWYPDTMRLYRQETDGDWSGVVSEIADALRSTPTGR